MVMRLGKILILLCFSHLSMAQVYQGLVVPDNKGRFGNTSPITQASGLAPDPNGVSLWTHNDQGNPTKILYKILPASGNQQVTIQKEVTIDHVTNLDWEDLALDDSGHMYVCQIGKNCNANSDPEECPTRFVFKIHKVSVAALNHPDSSAVTPVTYYFTYPLTGYDVNNCDGDDTVFVNSEAAVWHNGAIYLFTKNIWSKSTHNCGGWIEGYTYYFKLDLVEGSTMDNPLTAVYMGKFNMKIRPDDIANEYQVTAAAIHPVSHILCLTTYGRIWQFRDFTADDFFGGNAVCADYSATGTDTITRGYEGVEFISPRRVHLCVDGVNGRVSSVDLDSLACWVRNTNDDGAGSLRRTLLSVPLGDTIFFKNNLAGDTIDLDSALIIGKDAMLNGIASPQIHLVSNATNVMQIQAGVNATIKQFTLIGGMNSIACVRNEGNLLMHSSSCRTGHPNGIGIHNFGEVSVRGVVGVLTD